MVPRDNGKFPRILRPVLSVGGSIVFAAVTKSCAKYRNCSDTRAYLYGLGGNPVTSASPKGGTSASRNMRM